MLPRLYVLLACLGLAVTVTGAASATHGKRVAPHAVPVRLLAHDVSHALRGRAHAHPHLTPRRRIAGPLFVSPLTSLLQSRSLSSASRSLAPVTLGSWDGTAGPGGYAPADPNGDIGMTEYVQAINFRLAVYSRAAGHRLLAITSSGQFWNGLGGPDAAGLCGTSPGGDPVVQYDRLADRWVVSEFAFDVDGAGTPLAPFVQCVAVSTSPDATGTWNRYAFQITSAKFPDYPKLGIWPDGYYLSYNQFDLTTGSFAGAGALALQRSAMLAGGPAQARYFDLQSVDPGLGGMQPATMDATNLPSVGAPELYLQSLDDPNNQNDRLQLWTFHVDWAAPVTNSAFDPIADLPVTTFDSVFSCGAAGPDCIAQPGNPPNLPPNLDQVSTVVQGAGTVVPQLMYHLDYVRDTGGTERLVATQTVNAGGHTGVRWYQLTNGGAGWSVLQQGTYAPDTDNRFMSSGGIDNSGELALAYSVSSTATFPSLRYTGRLPGDAAGVMSIPETSIFDGQFSQTDSGRWGDYSSLSLDPLDLCTFWFTGEYATATGWATRIGEFNFSTCVAQSPTRPVLTVDPSWSTPIVREGQTITGAAGTFAGSTGVTDQWRRCDRSGFSCVDIPGETGLTHVFTAADAAGDRTVRFQQTATNATGTVVTSSVQTPVVQSLPPVNVTRPVISGNAQSGGALSTTNGTWTSSSPISYTYRWRRCTTSCVFIPGANTSSYAPTTADVGATLDVVVSATNTGGGTDANADPTPAVQSAPTPAAGSTGGGSGGGGSTGGSGGGSTGGGGGGTPDLSVTGAASAASAAVGDNIVFTFTVADKNGVMAQGLLLNISLPSGLQYVSSALDRGNGCALQGASLLRCDLAYLSVGAAAVAHVQVVAKVVTLGSQSLSATASSAQGELNASDNTATVVVNVLGGSGVPTGLNGDGTPTKTQDTKKPASHALASTGRRGQVAKLRFKVYDDHGVANVKATVKRNGHAIAKLSTGFGPVVYGSVYFRGWKVPAKAAKGSYSFCVVAVDRAGNTSAQSCAPLALK